MKSLFLLLIFVNSLNAFTQEKWKIVSVSLQTGETTLTKGNTVSLVLSKQKSVWIFDINNELGEAIYLHYPKEWFSIGYSEGFLKNSLWAGPIATLNLSKIHLKTMHWYGWSLGDPEVGSTTEKVKFCFNYQQADWSFKNWVFIYVYSKYQKLSSCNYVGLKKVFPIKKDLSAFGTGLYCFENKEYLWSMGLSYSFSFNK